MYLETHCHIGSKRAFNTGVLDKWHNCLLLYWCTTCLVPAFDARAMSIALDHTLAMQRTIEQYRSTDVADNLGTQCTAQGKDFKVILTVKIETRHPVGRPFGREFSAFVIIAELWQPKVARPGIFVSNFCVSEQRSLSNCRLCADRAQNMPGPVPKFGSNCSRFHPNQFTFGGVIAERVKTVFAPSATEYLQHSL